MSGIQNTPPQLPGAPTPRLAAPAAAPAPAATAGPGDQLAASQVASELARLRVQVNSPSAAEASMALYRLEALAATHRAQVLPLLIQQLHGAGTNQLAAIDILQRLKAPEAASALEALAQSGDPAVRAAAMNAHGAISGPPPQPAAPAMPGIPAAPTGPAGPAAPAASPALTSSRSADLIARLLNEEQAPGAVVELSRMPAADMMAVVNRVVHDFPLKGETLDLLATLLSKRVREPGVAAGLQAITRKDAVSAPRAVGKAALALLSTGDLKYLPDVLRAVAQPSSELVPVKRAIIDHLAKSPTALAHPAAAVVLAAVLNEGEGPNSDLAAAASHALGKIKSAQARDALANSPLLTSGVPKLQLRAIWDLGQHPPPYPPAALQRLQALAQDTNTQVAEAARQLLGRKG